MKRYEGNILHHVDWEGDWDLQTRTSMLQSYGLEVVSSYVVPGSPGETMLVVQGTKEQFMKDVTMDGKDPHLDNLSSWRDYRIQHNLTPLPASKKKTT